MRKLLILFFIIYTPPLFGTVITNYTGTCGNFRNLNVIFELIQTTCDMGYFLPAASTTCAVCPTGYTCTGGTFAYNQTQSQGLTRNTTYYITNEVKVCASNFPRNLNAVFELTGYTCASGTYLPANATTCTTCPTGYTCSGGTYNLDADNDQGLVANSIAITWKNEDGTTLTTNACTYGQPITIPANPTKTGYTFNGWTVVSK